MDYTLKYLKYKEKYIRLKSQHNMMGGGDKIDIILFKADWCGHCKTLKPTWDKIKTVFNKKFNFITYDSDNDEKEFERYNVNSFPTIIIKDGKHIKHYDGPRDEASLINLFNELEPASK